MGGMLCVTGVTYKCGCGVCGSRSRRSELFLIDPRHRGEKLRAESGRPLGPPAIFFPGARGESAGHGELSRWRFGGDDQNVAGEAWRYEAWRILLADDYEIGNRVHNAVERCCCPRERFLDDVSGADSEEFLGAPVCAGRNGTDVRPRRFFFSDSGVTARPAVVPSAAVRCLQRGWGRFFALSVVGC